MRESPLRVSFCSWERDHIISYPARLAGHFNFGQSWLSPRVFFLPVLIIISVLTDERAAPSLSLQGRDTRVDPFMGYNVKLLVHNISHILNLLKRCSGMHM